MGMASAGLRARDLARRLAEAEIPDGAPLDAAALHAACERFYRQVTRWTGAHGCHALFSRARSLTKDAHPVLEHIDIQREMLPHLSGLPGALDVAGEDATAAAFEGLLISVLDQLGRFIGEDMVAALVRRAVLDPDPLEPAGPQSGGPQ